MKVLRITTILGLALSSCHPRKEACSRITAYPGFISKDTANLMVASYISSLNYNDTDLHSIVFSAKELRYYLDSMPNSNMIEQLEVKFAHKQDYILAGNTGKPAGLSSNALTLILVGLDAFGNYVFAGGQNVINRGMPCPTNCPSSNTPL